MRELLGWLQRSDADFVILGGDFNTDPRETEPSFLSLNTAMVNSMEEFFQDMKVKLFKVLIDDMNCLCRNAFAQQEPLMGTQRTPTAPVALQHFMTTFGIGLVRAIPFGQLSLM